VRLIKDDGVGATDDSVGVHQPGRTERATGHIPLVKDETEGISVLG